MGKNSKIAWTDHTFNAWIGCQKVSPGCQFCYAENETFTRRERAHGRELWGPKGSRHRTSTEYWQQPLKWNSTPFFECVRCHWRGEWPSRVRPAMCPECLGALNPARPRVFCMSLGDVLEDRPELIPWRKELVGIIESTPNLDWLLLTKRIELAGELLPTDWFFGKWPANVWMGTSIENQKMADKRIPELIAMPAPIRFLSVEPMLEPIELGLTGTLPNVDFPGYRMTYEFINWVIVGGESGRKCRPFKWDWARAVKNDCLATNIAFFMKQGGGYPDKRDNLDDFPFDLRLREWPDDRRN